MKVWHRFAIGALLVTLAMPAVAQSRAESLADIRQELSFLHVEMQHLRQELSTTGSSQGTGEQGTVLQRLDALEGELRRITGKVEELDFRIDKIVRDGTNRIGDLEFRLVELEGGDVSTLGETSTLGGGDINRQTLPVITSTDASSELAVSEQVDFETAKRAFDNGEFQLATNLFGAFTETYPGGPLTGEAHFWRGEALASQGDWRNAARSFLQSYSSGPNSTIAPDVLLRLGVSVGKIGVREDACVMLNEVTTLYPESGASLKARAEMVVLGCSE